MLGSYRFTVSLFSLAPHPDIKACPFLVEAKTQASTSSIYHAMPRLEQGTADEQSSQKYFCYLPSRDYLIVRPYSQTNMCSTSYCDRPPAQRAKTEGSQATWIV
jgi:hypothetical protein